MCLRDSGTLLSVELAWTVFHRLCIHASASLALKPLLASVPAVGPFLAAASDPLALLALALRSAPDMAAAAMADDVDCIIDNLDRRSKSDEQDDVLKYEF